jgi:L-threonylcarbamoyladenylate synthase
MHEDDRPSLMDAHDPAALDSAAMALVAGGIVGLPTETVYGLAVVPRPEALEALLAAKQRPETKGITLLIDDHDQVSASVMPVHAARALVDRFWPGPLTLVLPLRDGVVLPDALTGSRGTLGVRLPDHAVPRALARRLGPLATTSANRSGEADTTTAEALVSAIGASVALVLDDGPVRGGVASTVVAFDAAGGWQLLREGAIERAAIEAALVPSR